MKKNICLWCGRSHKKAPRKCKDLSIKASGLIKDGVPVCVLFAILHAHGEFALSSTKNFEAAAKLTFPWKFGSKR